MRRDKDQPELAAAGSAAEWALLLQDIADPVFVHDAECRILAANPAYAARAGLPLESLIGRPYWEVFPRREGPLPACARAMSDPSVAHRPTDEFTLDSGETLRSRALPVRSPDGGFQHSVHVLEDISAEQRLGQLVAIVPDVLFVLELPDLAPSFVSPASAQVLGWTPEAFVSDPELWRRQIEPEDTPGVMNAVEEAMSGPGAAVHRFRFRHAGGDVLWLEGRVVAERSADGAVKRLVGALTDVTGHTRAEQLLGERIKEQTCLYGIARAAQTSTTLPELARRAVQLLPPAMQSPGLAVAAVEVDGALYAGDGYAPDLAHCLDASIRADGEGVGRVRVCYRETAPFLKPEEPALLRGVAETIGLWLERHRAVQALQQVQRVVENSPTVLFETQGDDAWRVGLVTSNVHRLGYAADDFLSGRLSLTDLIHPDDRERVSTKKVEHARGSEGSFRTEYRILDGEGRVRWVNDVTQPIRDANGSVLRYQCVLSDVTEQREGAEALRHSQARLNLAVEASDAALWDVELDPGDPAPPDAIHLSDRHKAIIGFSPDELPSSRSAWFSRIPPAHRERVEQAVRAHLEGRTGHVDIQYPVRHRDGSLRWIHSHGRAQRDEAGRPVRLTGIDHDITEHRQAEAALRASEERYTALFRQMLDAFALHEIILDAEGKARDYRFLEVNPAFERMTGLSADAVVGRTVLEILPDTEPDWIERYAEVVRTGEAIAFERYSRALDRHFNVQAYRPRAGQFATLFLDTTERVQAEAALARKNRALTVLSECNTALVYARSEQGLVEEICRVITDAGGYPLAWVGYREPGPEQRVRTVAAAGAGIGYMQGMQVGWGEDPLGEGPTGTAIRTGEPVISHDLSRDQGYAPWSAAAREQGFGSCIALPLNLEDQTIGNLTIFATEPEAFAPEEQALLVEMSYDLAFGIRALRERASREAAVQALEASEQRLSTIIEKNADAILVTDLEGRVRFANPAAAHLLGRETTALLGQPFAVPPGEHPNEIEIVRPDGTRVPAELRNVNTHWGGQPAHLLTLLDLSERHRLEEERLAGARHLQAVLMQTIEAVSLTVEKRDPYTAGHQRRVAELAAAIGRELGLDEDQIVGIHTGGLIHDIGKIYVPAEILARPGRLTEMEYELIKTHAQIGREIIAGVDFPWPVADMVGQHHERLDGSGYPLGLAGEAIAPEARIMAVADVVEAISSHRPYRPALGLEPALDEISRQRGILFDPDAVDACLTLFREKGFAFERGGA
jgi:PAS domain S-box-containing protein/putative nucleotidyltransferase with HDIG domain